MVLKTMSSNDVKQRWGSVMSTVGEPDDAVIVESHGKPRAAVISFERFQKLRELEEKERREGLLRRLDDLESKYDGRNDDLTDEEIQALADRFSHEFIDDLAAEGKLRFARDRKA